MAPRRVSKNKVQLSKKLRQSQRWAILNARKLWIKSIEFAETK